MLSQINILFVVKVYLKIHFRDILQCEYLSDYYILCYMEWSIGLMKLVKYSNYFKKLQCDTLNIYEEKYSIFVSLNPQHSLNNK